VFLPLGGSNVTYDPEPGIIRQNEAVGRLFCYDFEMNLASYFDFKNVALERIQDADIDETVALINPAYSYQEKVKGEPRTNPTHYKSLDLDYMSLAPWLRKYYEGYGFRETGESVRWGTIDLIHMSKDLES